MFSFFKKVWDLAKPYRFRLILGLACGFLSGALAFALPLSVTLAVNTVFPDQVSFSAKGGTNEVAGVSTNEVATTSKPQKSGFSSKVKVGWVKYVVEKAEKWLADAHGSTVSTAIVIALIPLSMLIKGVLMYLNMYMLSWVGVRTANDLRARVFDHIMHLPLGFFTKSSTGDLMARIEGAVAVNNTIASSFGTLIREPISIIVLVITLMNISSTLTLVTMTVFPVCLIPVIVYARKLRHSSRSIHSKFSHLAQVMHEAFTSTRVIKAYNLENTVVEQFRQAVKTIISFHMRTVRASEIPGPLIEFIGAIGVALIFAYYAFLSKGQAPVGSMLGFFICVFGIYQPVKNLSRLNSQVTLAQLALDPIYQVLAIKTTLPEPANPKPLQAQNAPIRFEGVNFSYGEKTVLHDINLTIKPGQLVALVGRTGSGKTSIANLLLRFYDPQKGAILIGDTDIRQVSSKDLRGNIAMVTQETILFNNTIRHNIALGRPGASNAEIEEAAKNAYAHDFILEKPQGYECPAGEKGVNLSGGQKQRIAIARAILKKAPILILDEATSALDNESERIVQKALEELMKSCTTICIAHRLSTIQRADVIVVLDEGRIVEQGDHASLMKQGGLYYKLFSLGMESAPA